jgi:16S rRNA processing protein RimM
VIAIGKVVGVFGIRGFVKVALTTHNPERVRKLKTVAVGVSESNTIPTVIEETNIGHRGVVMRFRAVIDRTGAEALVGKHIFVEDKDVERPKRGSFFVHDIIGCRVFSTDGDMLGTVEDVVKLPAQDQWVVRSGERTFMIPAVRKFVKKVDVKARRIVVRIIEGLIEEQT